MGVGGFPSSLYMTVQPVPLPESPRMTMQPPLLPPDPRRIVLGEPVWFDQRVKPSSLASPIHLFFFIFWGAFLSFLIPSQTEREEGKEREVGFTFIVAIAGARSRGHFVLSQGEREGERERKWKQRLENLEGLFFCFGGEKRQFRIRVLVWRKQLRMSL